ncbi:hypothetical protein [Bacillus horti]|uniref:Uncharacterized protein n=1 Tax=Caldalkalibacillus horti TaxID=77523 RepID=A0ABT9VVQ8_9BACI|nr:hypothetical protein [Bacillus horti]MDQ0165056.1 hypothetical protein [Bacillus horti]
MKIFVNNQEIELFQGATVKHALLKANPELYHLVYDKKADVFDQEGNPVELHGAVSSGWSYQVLNKK